jgi:hypothetical protein
VIPSGEAGAFRLKIRSEWQHGTISAGTPQRRFREKGMSGHCLVILLGQTRSSGLTARSFETFVRSSINPHGRVDIALCRCEGYAEPDSYFAPQATHVWECPQPHSWNEVFTEVARKNGVPDPNGWETLLPIPGNWMGEITERGATRAGSAARCLALRHHALEMIERLRLQREYSWFILSRSDYLYLAPHPPLDLLGSDGTWIPRGEGYGGVTDRHVVFPAHEARRALDLLRPLVTDPVSFRRRLHITCDWNLERFLKVTFLANGLYRGLRRFPPVGFLVRNADAETSWSQGSLDESLGYFVKYPAERAAAVLTAGQLTEAGGWTKALLSPTVWERFERLLVGAVPDLYPAKVRLGPAVHAFNSRRSAWRRAGLPPKS